MLFIIASLKSRYFKRSCPAAIILVAGLAITACGGGGGASVPSTGNGSQSSRAASSTFFADSSFSSTFSSALSSVPAEISSSSAASSEKKFVEIHWVIPNQRVNGDHMDISEIGGYELRYKQEDDEFFTSIVIKDKNVATYYLNDLRGDYEFRIAVFDVAGLYSEFVSVERM